MMSFIIIQGLWKPNAHVDESLKFVKEFHNTTFNSETSGTLSTYMEKTTGDNTTLQFVSLNSSLKQLAWADFNGEQLTTPGAIHKRNYGYL